MLLAIVLFILFLIAIGVSVYCVWDYERFVTQMANQYSFEEIENIIKEDVNYLNNCNLKGIMWEQTLDHMELWCAIRKRKIELDKDNYEDIVS